MTEERAAAVAFRLSSNSVFTQHVIFKHLLCSQHILGFVGSKTGEVPPPPELEF